MKSKSELFNTQKPPKADFVSSYGIDYLNRLLQRIINQKEYSKIHAPNQIQHWRRYELTVRKCINLAQGFASEF